MSEVLSIGGRPGVPVQLGGQEIQEGEVDRMGLTVRPDELESGGCVTLGKVLHFSGPSLTHHKVGLMTSAPGGGVRLSVRQRSVEFFAQT